MYPQRGDYYIGEFKDGLKHECDWFAYMFIIHNIW